MNESLQKYNLNEFDTIEADNENNNLKTIIIPGLTLDNDFEQPLKKQEVVEDKTYLSNHETVIESAEDIFIFSKPDGVSKNSGVTKIAALSGLTQIPTAFASEKGNSATDQFKSNIFLNNEEKLVAPLKQIKQKTTSNVVLSRKPSSTKQATRKIHRSQKSYGLVITLLFCLIVASALFVLHLNNTINLHQITFDLYENSKTILSNYNKNDLIKGWIVLFT